MDHKDNSSGGNRERNHESSLAAAAILYGGQAVQVMDGADASTQVFSSEG